MSIRQYRMDWTGLPGGVGYSFFYTTTAVDATSNIPPMVDAIKQYFPTPLIWKGDGSYRTINEVDGTLENVTVSQVPWTVSATGANTYMPQAGAQTKWFTNGFPDGRRVVGRTYWVPTITGALAVDGKLSATLCNTINAAADAFRSRNGGEQVVWHRPIFETPPDPKPPGYVPVVKRPGSYARIVSCTTPTKPATLNARRDT